MRAIGKDVLIIGGGPVGASFALGLEKTPYTIALVESRPPAPAAGWDTRIYAISPGSRRFLQGLKVWDSLDANRLGRVRRMLVFGDRGARLEFSAYETGVPELAWIAEAGALARALWARLERQTNLETLCPASPRQLQIAESVASLTLDSGEEIQAGLIVGADGAQSFVRREAGIAARNRPYGQHGVVANFACQRPHGGTAFQWFRDDGVLAWLPLPGERFSMVWSTPHEHARALLDLTPDALCRRVAEASGNALGPLALLTPPASFPIAQLKVAHVVSSRVALIGDAAHVVHPLAGQGVNLGFSDAAELARILGEAAPRDPGSRLFLRRYERARKEDVLAMRWTTDGLANLFALPSMQGLRNWGMNSVNAFPVIKALLARHALG